MVDYSPLWKTMQEKGITQYYLLKHGIDSKVIYKLKRNGNITIYTLEKLCAVIDCKPNDIVAFHN